MLTEIMPISTITIMLTAIKAMITETDRAADITEAISTDTEHTEDSRRTAILSITDSRDITIIIRPMQDFILLLKKYTIK